MKKKIIEDKLETIFDLLYNEYGPQSWWPAKTSFEVSVGAILTQSTSWNNVEKVIDNLSKENVLSIQGVRLIDIELLSTLIRPSLYHNVKARKLKEFIGFLDREAGGSMEGLKSIPLSVLRPKLLSVWGIGPETCDSILLYALDKPSFVVDAYTRRIFSRLGLLDGGEDYDFIKSLFESNLPGDVGLYNEYHALIVELAKNCCLTRNMICDKCPVSGLCSYFKSSR